jgi:hypothetical protein
MLGDRNCNELSCGRASVVTLIHRDFCLEHFLLYCYEMLERLDPRGRSIGSQPVDLASMRAFIEECSRKALDISLRSDNLSNLERGRLLDILLWAGELFLVLRAPRLTFSESLASEVDQTALRAAVPSR